jgi:small GTP-binding protein
MKNSDINVEGNDVNLNKNPNPLISNKIDINNININNNNSNNNYSNQKSLQRKVQNPSQSSIQKNKIKSRFDSEVLEMEEVNSNSFENKIYQDNKRENSKEKKPNEQYSKKTNNQNIFNDNQKNPNINANQENFSYDLKKENLSGILKIKEINKEYHIEKDCINIVFLGERCCGKSSIVFQYMNNKFEPYYIQTMFKESFRKEVFYEEKKVNLNIIVTSGVEQYQEDYTNLYKSSDFFVVCYDITSNASFLKAKDIICNDLLPYVFLYNEGTSNIFLIGNKTDLKEKCVDVNQVIEFSMKYKIKFYESSAKNNNNINSTFNKIIEIYHETVMNK